jgi:hypothetical protein
MMCSMTLQHTEVHRAHHYSSTQIDAILLDFSKAFDKVSHERLAAKLHHCGVRGPTLNWIKSFLAGRTQREIFSFRCDVQFLPMDEVR